MSKLPLLPADRYIADLLGLDDEQYRFYVAEVRRRAQAQPQPAVVADAAVLATIALVANLISIGLTIAASFFKPRAQPPPRLQQTQTQGTTITNARRFIPRTGFDSAQDVASIGDVIPLVYTRREQINGQFYGGVRINAPLLWSQVFARDHGLVMRAIYLLGEGHPGIEIDPANIALGNNTLGSYLLGNETARFSAYFRPDGGRITASDLLVGASDDPGSATPEDVYAIEDENGQLAPYFCHARRPSSQTQFGVYSLIGNAFGFRVNPSLRPGVNAQITVDVSGGGKKGGASAQGRVVCEPDYVSLAQREKFKARFSGRSGLIAQSGNTWTYHLSNTTDAETLFTASGSTAMWSTNKEVTSNPFPSISDSTVASWLILSPVVATSSTLTTTATLNTIAIQTALASEGDGTYVIGYYIYFQRDSKNIVAEHTVSITRTTTTDSNGNPVVTYSYTNQSATISTSVNDRTDLHQERAGDAASVVSGRQKTWDDNLQVGELIKVGSALAICTGRQPADRAFNSDADFEPITPSQGNAVNITLEVIRPGAASTVALNDLVKGALNNPPFQTATSFPQLFRVAIANIATERECSIVELTFRSSLGIRVSGLCNFRDTLTYQQIDARACYDKEGNSIRPGDYLTVDIYQSGQINTSEERYSFFRIRYREAGLEGPYTELAPCFGIRGITQQEVFNDIRLVMPARKRWEFQLEPLSGWEIRSGTASGDLELIDSSFTTRRSISSNGVTVSFRGLVTTAGPFIPAAQRATLGPERFRLASGQSGGTGEIGIGYSDGTSYLDAWGKLAEAFVYEEVQSSATSAPEHEIVNINEITPNTTPPLYNHLALLGFNVRSGSEFQQLGQMSVHYKRGLADGTHRFPEVLADVLTNGRYGKGDQVTTLQINTDSFAAALTWIAPRNYFWDGAVVGRINIRQWAADVAAAHLLFFGESGGQFWLRPAWPGTIANPEPVVWAGIFTAGNIAEGTFALEFLEPEERRPIQVSVRFREERLATNPANPGLFPIEREILVREAAPFGADTDPIEPLDLSEHGTSRQQAIDAAKFVARLRRLVDHVVKFGTTHEGVDSAIQPGDYVKVAMAITHFNVLQTGVVLPSGQLVSPSPLTDGTHTVLAWNGDTTTPPETTTLVVENGAMASGPSGVIFTVMTEAVQEFTYQLERIAPAEDGGFSIEAVHMPLDSDRIPLLAKGFDAPENWVIQE